MATNSKRIHEQEDSNFVQYAKYTAKTYLLMMKNHFKSSSFYLGNLLIPIIVTLTTCILFPIWFGFMWSMFIAMSFAGFSAYGTLLFSIRKSTLKKNIDMTAAESSALYSAMLMVIFTVTLITFNIIFGSILLFDLEEINILSHNFFFDTPAEGTISYIDWGKVSFDLIFYYWFAQGLVVFSMSFFIERVAATQKNFFIIIFVYLLGGMFFSGIWSPTIYSNTGFILANDLAPGVAEGQYFVPTKEWVETYWIGDNYIAGAISSNQKGGTLWWIGQLWPHFGLNQIAFDSLKTGWVTETNGVVSYMVDGDSIWKHLADDPIISYYMGMPWLYVFLGVWIGGMIARFGDK